MNKITLTVKEAAELIGVSTTSVYTMVRENQIPHTRVRSKIIFHKGMLESWLKGDLKVLNRHENLHHA
ncbi:helix-turn-helix domain-containing protein [Peribacillus phoenicis]|uniref:helix-turn-helix domain-containing protein n=1 Tax=unclassified Peribacillus TaxID=2675266 RepID=UPI0039A29E62